jgi:lipoyl(octanoyl) transferase
MKRCHVVELGVIGYAEAWALQERLVAARKRGDAPDVLLLCEHPPVITLGRSGKIENLRVSDALLHQKGVEFHRTNRGGDITYHGPGQLVGYPVLQLGEIRRDVVWYVRMLEEAMIRASAAFGVEAVRIKGCTGVWVRPEKLENAPQPVAEEKLGAIGVHISRWVTSHGFAYNVSTDLRYFDLIVPCGIVGRGTTSLEKLLGRPVAREEPRARVIEGFGAAFDFEMVAVGRDELNGWAARPEPEIPGVAATGRL